jgi:hypothetical protein
VRQLVSRIKFIGRPLISVIRYGVGKPLALNQVARFASNSLNGRHWPATFIYTFKQRTKVGGIFMVEAIFGKFRPDRFSFKDDIKDILSEQDSRTSSLAGLVYA